MLTFAFGVIKHATVVWPVSKQSSLTGPNSLHDAQMSIYLHASNPSWPEHVLYPVNVCLVYFIGF